MFVTNFPASKPICIHDETNAENTQVKSSGTLQANRSGNYINKFIYQLILLIQIYIRLMQHDSAMTCSHLQEILNVRRHVELKRNFDDSKW